MIRRTPPLSEWFKTSHPVFLLPWILVGLGFLVEPVDLSARTSDRFFESLRNNRSTVENSPSVDDTAPSDSPALRQSDTSTSERSRKSSPENDLRLRPEINPGLFEEPLSPLVPKIDTDARRLEQPQNRRIIPKRRETDPFVKFDTRARAFDDSFYIGLRWPGVSVGFRESPYTIEFKYLEDPNDVQITGLRLYHHLLRIESNNLYWGIDFARLSFEGSVSEGTGNSTGLYMGFEKRVMNRITWSLDVGPYFIHLRDDSTNITQEGLEFTMTSGLNVALF